MEALDACSHQMEGIAKQLGKLCWTWLAPHWRPSEVSVRLCRQNPCHAGAVAAARQSRQYNQETTCLWRGRRW